MGVEYHGEVLAVGYCRSVSSLGVDDIIRSIDSTLRSALMRGSCNGSCNFVKMVDQSVSEAFHGKCLFNSIVYAPAIENVNITYKGVEKHGAVIYVRLGENKSNACSTSKDFLTIRISRNDSNINIIVLALPLIMFIKKFADYMVKDSEETRIEHYYLLIGVSYLSLSLFIHFIAWTGAAFQNTMLVELMCTAVAALLLVLGVWIVIIIFDIMLIIIIMSILLKMTIILLNLFPIKFYGISTSIAIGVSVVYMILLTLLNIDNINAISAAYGISLTIASIILSFELVYTFMIYDIASSPMEFLMLLAMLACYVVCVSAPSTPAAVRARQGV